jgi:putative transposase
MYPSDLTDKQWKLLAPHLVKPMPVNRRRGRHPKQDFRTAVSGILYVMKTGCQWRFLPKDFPPWQTVYGCFRRWRLDGSWAKAMQALREAARQKAGKNPKPSVAILDSRSVKSAQKGGSAVTMPVKKPKGESSTSPSIPWDSF